MTKEQFDDANTVTKAIEILESLLQNKYSFDFVSIGGNTRSSQKKMIVEDILKNAEIDISKILKNAIKDLETTLRLI
jgi:deoxyhypusine synthase